MPGQAALLRGALLLLLVLPGNLRAEEIAAVQGDDQEVAALFQAVETSFKNKRVQDLIANVHRDFSYTMTYSTDDSFSALKNDIATYRESLGAFFQSNPEIQDYAIKVEQIERSGEETLVLARIRSVVQLNGVVNSCEAFSNYTLLHEKGRLLIKTIRGDATCANTQAKQK